MRRVKTERRAEQQVIGAQGEEQVWKRGWRTTSEAGEQPEDGEEGEQRRKERRGLEERRIL